MLIVKPSSGKLAPVEEQTEALVGAWLSAQRSPNTRAAYARDIGAFLAWCAATHRPPFASTTGDLDDYRDSCLTGGASAATVARRLSGIASFFRYAAGAGLVEANPVESVDRPAPEQHSGTRILSDEELADLVDAATELGPKTAALVTLLALDGMKLGEALAIDVPDLRLGPRSGSVSVDRHDGHREVRLARPTAKAVADYVAGRRRGPLFVGDSAVAQRTTRLTRFGADFLIKRAGSAAGIAGPVSANVLRRSYVAAARRAGDTLEAISAHVGHREVRETARLVDEAALSRASRPGR